MFGVLSSVIGPDVIWWWMQVRSGIDAPRIEAQAGGRIKQRRPQKLGLLCEGTLSSTCESLLSQNDAAA